MAGVNKVIGKNGETIIDISEDTVTAALLAEGATAHAANGDVVTGIGKDTSFIDDTAGEEDIGYVWSADKSYKEITNLKRSTKGFTSLKNLFYKIITQSDNFVDLKITNYENGYYNGNGAFVQNDNYITYIIEVEPSTQYYISAYRHYLTFWNYNTYISRIGTSSTVQTDQIITTPNNANIIKVSFYLLSSVDPTYIDNFMLIAGNQIPGEYISPRPTLSDYLNIPGKKEIENHNKIKYNEKFTPVFQMTLNKIISDTNGEINNSTSNNVCADEIYYPLESEKKYIFWSDAIHYNVYFYDENFSFKECIYTNNGVKVYPIIYINTNDYAYFRVGGYYSQGASNVINTLHVTMTNNPKKIVCLGDSLTAGVGANIAYHMYLARYTGWTCQNWGAGGSGWATRGSNNTKVGNGIEGIPSNNSAPEYNTEFTAAVQVIPKDADLYIVFGGYNDWNTDKSETAFTNAVETTISYIQENMPSSRILVMTPTQRYKVGEKDGNIQNNAGLTIKDYCQIIKNVCEDHSIPCLDLYSTSLLYPYSTANSTEYFAADGAHINDNGQKLVFEAMTEKAISLLALK